MTDPFSPVLVFLDVDGVILPLGDEGPPDVRGVEFCQVGPAGAGWLARCWYSPAVLERLKGWATSGLVELQWLTSWQHEANELLPAAIGLGPFDLAYAGDGPWPKAATVQHTLARTNRRVVWCDDEISDRQAAGQCPDLVAQYDNRVRLVCPAKAVGLLPAHLDELEAWLRS